MSCQYDADLADEPGRIALVLHECICLQFISSERSHVPRPDRQDELSTIQHAAAMPPGSGWCTERELIIAGN